MVKTWKERAAIVQQCHEETRANGQSVQQWCDEKGLSTKTLYNWKRRTNGGINSVSMDMDANSEASQTQKRQWAVLPAFNSKTEDEESPNNRETSYRITCGGFTINLTNNIKTDTLTEVLKAVKQACC